MDKVDAALTHGITIAERSNLIISGVKKIDSFDNEEFLMETSMGYLMIKGDGLEIIKLDTYQGNVNIKGKVNSVSYIDDIKNKEREDGGVLIGCLNNASDVQIKSILLSILFGILFYCFKNKLSIYKENISHLVPYRKFIICS